MQVPESQGRVYVGLLGLDQHEAGALTVARLLSESGFEVVYGGRFNTPQSIVSAAVEEDVDLIGVSCHSWEYLYHVEDLIAGLREAGHAVPVVVGGSIITGRDQATLARHGVAAAFGPSAPPDEIVAGVTRLVADSRAARSV